MNDLQQNLDQFFQDNDRGYPRDPRRLAYKKLQKNTQGMDREQLEAFIKANLFIPHSQYKMALGNLIQFLKQQDQMNKLNEVKRFQKIAGLIKEDDYSESPSSDMDDESQSGDTDAMNINEDDEYANIPNTVEGWVNYLYTEANPKQKAKLASIYREQMDFEEAIDARDFFLDLIDSSDPEAIIPLEDLDQYSGY